MSPVRFSEDDVQRQFADLSGIRFLKAGGQKSVYAAVHATHGDVVLKLIDSRPGDERILREIEIVRQNSFPHVPRILDSGHCTVQSADQLFLVEQRIEGDDLRTLLQRNGKLPFAQVVRCLSQLLETIESLEAARIVHRDIKPENILLDRTGDFWLLDFGIARDLENVSLTATSSKFGPFTVGYAPPEQMFNMKSMEDSRCDLFALGVTAYELFSGRHPFADQARSVVEVITRVSTVSEPMLTLADDPLGEITGFVRTLMQKVQSLRPPDAKSARAWFLNILSNRNDGR